MPIRINLLSEAQVAEEMRRRNPVKMAAWIAGFCVVAVGLWAVKVELDIYFARQTLAQVEKQADAVKTGYMAMTNNQVRLAELQHKINALDNLSTNRFLWANVLNALQLTTVGQIQVTRFRGEQGFKQEDPREIAVGSARVHVPGGMVERTSLRIEAKDNNPDEGTYSKFKDALSANAYFQKLTGVRDGFVLDGAISQQMVDPMDPSKKYTTFTLLAKLQDKRRNE